MTLFITEDQNINRFCKFQIHDNSAKKQVSSNIANIRISITSMSLL